ncbi:MAG: sulfur carrier protein ThiS [Pseudomonadota bacterium]
MQIHINGEATRLSQALALNELLQQLPDLPENYAIAVNATFVPRSAYTDTRIQDGDQVELLVPMQGG